MPLIVSLSALHLFAYPGLLRSPFYVAFLFSAAIFCLACAHTHKWAHERTHRLSDSAVVNALQDAHVILPPGTHQAHHVEQDDDARLHFSLSSGAVEPVLDRIFSLFKGGRPMGAPP